MCARLGKDGDPQLVHVSGNYVPVKDEERGGLYPTPFLVNNFLFAQASMFDEVPVDPHFHFYGDEISYAARLWTHGYDVFQPDCMVLYHYWIREKQMHLQHYRRTDTQRSYLSLLRGRHLLGLEKTDDKLALKEIEGFGLGSQRKLDDLWEFAGVDLKNGQVTKEATEGCWNMVKREQAIKESGVKQTKSVKKKTVVSKQPKKKSPVKSKRPTIFVQIACYRDPELQWTIKEHV